MITKIEAVRSLFGRDSYDKCTGDGVVTWKDGHTTTEEETAQINAEYDRLQTEYDNQEYARKRKAEYPIIADQLDDIYHNGIDGWKATIKITKDKYPKG
jgi:hypothetical protein|tara:strand:+ start:624 stop:920 length:297 start_codon:yes stop_codon:yes gene_type:complete